MALNRMRAAAVAVLRKQGVPQAVIDVYGSEFDRALERVDPPPCPTCFMCGEMSWLRLDFPNGIHVFGCTVCGEVFQSEDSAVDAPQDFTAAPKVVP